MKNIFYFIICPAIIVCSCKEDNYSTNIYLENKSSHSVHVLLTASINNTSKSIFMNPMEEVLIQTVIDKGSGMPQDPFDYSGSAYDTCFVIFNDTVALLYSVYEYSERNIMYTRNYTRSDGSGSRKYTHYIYRYTITEQDFLDAEPL